MCPVRTAGRRTGAEGERPLRPLRRFVGDLDAWPARRAGRRLDSKEAVVAWLAEVEADRAAGRYVDFVDD